MRADLFDFFSVYEPEFQYRWNDIFSHGRDALGRALLDACPEDLVQVEDGNRIRWCDDTSRTQALFVFVDDPTDLNGILETYETIKQERIPVSFVIVEQRRDGVGNYDIFRLSEESFLEHNNRAWPRGSSPDPL